MIDAAFWTLVALFVAVHAAALAITVARLRRAATAGERRQRWVDLCLFLAMLVIVACLLAWPRSGA